MSYPDATAEQVVFFQEHGYLVVEDAIPAEDLDELEGHLDELILQKEKYAFDWACASEDRATRRRPLRTRSRCRSG